MSVELKCANCFKCFKIKDRRGNPKYCNKCKLVVEKEYSKKQYQKLKLHPDLMVEHRNKRAKINPEERIERIMSQVEFLEEQRDIYNDYDWEQ